MRNVERLTAVSKHLILLVFVSYELVRLWWWGGNCGVVSFEKTPFFCSSPTTGTNFNLLVFRRMAQTEEGSASEINTG